MRSLAPERWAALLIVAVASGPLALAPGAFASKAGESWGPFLGILLLTAAIPGFVLAALLWTGHHGIQIIGAVICVAVSAALTSAFLGSVRLTDAGWMPAALACMAVGLGAAALCLLVAISGWLSWPGQRDST